MYVSVSHPTSVGFELYELPEDIERYLRNV